VVADTSGIGIVSAFDAVTIFEISGDVCLAETTSGEVLSVLVDDNFEMEIVGAVGALVITFL